MRGALEILADVLSRDPHAFDSLFLNPSYSSVFSPEFLNAETANILLILYKMTARDSNVRYMATLDLLNELNKEEFKVDGDPEIILSKSILQQLDDPVSIVSDSAMKCIAPLVRKVSIATLIEMTKKLCDKLLREEERNRDIAGIALKTMLSEAIDLATVDVVLCGLKPVLIRGIILSGTTTKIKCECLDLLCHVLLKYGSLQANDHEMLVGVLLSELNLNQANVGRRVVSCMASLASCLSGDLMEKAICKVVELLKRKSTEVEIKHGYIQMIVSLSLAAGNCFGRHLGDTVPLLLGYCSSAAETDELRDYSLQALESFLLRCPRHIPSYCDSILDRTLELLSYDPNFTGDMEEDTNDENGAEEEDDENVDEYTDDEDASWKVRRAALKCLAGLIVSRPQMLGILYEKACPKLIDRFKEREESVKMDVFSTFIELLRQTDIVIRGDKDTEECRCLLTQKVPNIVKAIKEQLCGKSVKTKAGAFAVLKELAVVLPDCLFAALPCLALQIETTLLHKSMTSNMKIGALEFTRTVFASCTAAGVSYYAIEAIFAAILSAVAEPNYIVAAEALRVCGVLVCSLHLNTEVKHIHEIYRAIIPRLTAQVENQEVKECAISCMALVISNFGDKISEKLPECLPVLADCMCDDELTSLTTVKAFSVIAASKLHLDLSCVLEYHVEEKERLTIQKRFVIAKLTTFIRQANGTLRQAALGTLNSIFVAYANKIKRSKYGEIIQELSKLISDSDLHTAPALELCVTLMNSNRALFSTVKVKILPQSLTLLSRSLLNARALSALNRCLTSLVNSGVMVFMTLLNRLLLCANTPSQSNGTAQSSGIKRQALLSISQCIAALCLAVDEKKCSSAMKRLTNIIKEHTNVYSAKRHLALLCLCEMGRKKDLSAHTNIANILITSISSPFDEIKSAASYALGNFAVGDFPKYFPVLLACINKNTTNRYFFLHSLMEVIVRKSVEKPQLQSSSVDEILSLLFDYFENEEKGVRNVVAECLGKIALIEPAKLVPALKAQISSPSAVARSTAVTAVRFSLVERSEKLDEILLPEISPFLELIEDRELDVKRAAVLALNAAARNKPRCIKDLLPELLPKLYVLTVTKCGKSIQTVHVGAAEHVGYARFELQTAALECVDTLLDTCIGYFCPSFMVPHLISGLDDHYNVKILCLSILSKLTEKCPTAVLADVDSLVDPLERTIFFKLEFDAVKYEVDRNEDMIRRALQEVASLLRISGGNCGHKLKNLLFKISTHSIRDKYASICSELWSGFLQLSLF